MILPILGMIVAYYSGGFKGGALWGPFLYCTLNEMKTRFTDLHARTVLGLQLVPSIIENIAPYLSPPVNTVSGSAPVLK
jgi:hypothetical protein